jgi:NAD(P)-dependent dehydrogenase (short-subunit alcohol dehydrogenase family)
MLSILITGANSGFGRLTAETLAKKGHTVFAGIRDVRGRNAAVASELEDAARASGLKLHVVELDVLDEASVRAAVEKAHADAGKLDVVINNAGFLIAGYGEGFTDDQLRSAFDTNVLGPQRVLRAALPHMRARGSGLIVTVSSTMAHVTYPYSSVYSATKRALEAFAETYRYELAPFGIDSVIITPGGFPTPIFTKMMTPSDVDRLAGYGPLAGAPQQFFDGFAAMMQGPGGPKPQDVADAIAAVIEMPAGTRPLRVAIDRQTPDSLKLIHETSQKAQEQVFAAFGMSALLSVKPADG